MKNASIYSADRDTILTHNKHVGFGRGENSLAITLSSLSKVNRITKFTKSVFKIILYYIKLLTNYFKH